MGQPRPGIHEGMSITFLGTGGSWPTAERNTACIAVKRGPEVILFDCGEGTQRQFQRSKLSYMQVRRVFVSHLHADHFLGLAGLLQTMSMNERVDPLEVYGPPGIAEIVAGFTRLAYFKPSFAIDVRELRDGDVVPFPGYRIEARAVKHNVPNLGYALVEDPRPGRFNKPRALELGVPEGPAFGSLQTGTPVTLADGRVVRPEDVLGPARRGRKIAYSGDAVPSEAMVELARDADVLVHDSTFGDDYAEANAYGHSTSTQAAYVAKKAGVRALYLTHFSARYRDVRPLLESARRLFEKTHAAHDFLEIDVAFTEEPAEASPEPPGVAPATARRRKA
ncbi:MAG TPA: ribonuclease Z [Candidatus Thermoplasmatota archaeon]|nr:ribonuclease Z [Candidatus Thermoplasmatota archaeon]